MYAVFTIKMCNKYIRRKQWECPVTVNVSPPTPLSKSNYFVSFQTFSFKETLFNKFVEYF